MDKATILAYSSIRFNEPPEDSNVYTHAHEELDHYVAMLYPSILKVGLILPEGFPRSNFDYWRGRFDALFIAMPILSDLSPSQVRTIAELTRLVVHELNIALKTGWNQYFEKEVFASDQFRN